MTESKGVQTENLDRLYLEWSQFTKARTARELALEAEVARLSEYIAFQERTLQSDVNKLKDRNNNY